jgi:hypothetical protein
VAVTAHPSAKVEPASTTLHRCSLVCCDELLQVNECARRGSSHPKRMEAMPSPRCRLTRRNPVTRFASLCSGHRAVCFSPLVVSVWVLAGRTPARHGYDLAVEKSSAPVPGVVPCEQLAFLGTGLQAMFACQEQGLGREVASRPSAPHRVDGIPPASSPPRGRAAARVCRAPKRGGRHPPGVTKPSGA